MPLPPGLLLNPATGELTGTPTVPGTYAIALKVRDVSGSFRELTDTVVINAYTLLAWRGSLGPLMDTRAADRVTVAVDNGLPPYTYSVYSGALPTGLSLNTTTGTIDGTVSASGPYACVLRVTDSIGAHADYVLAGTVAVNLTISSPNPNGTVGVSIDQQLDVAGGNVPYSYSVLGTLPAGLQFSNGRITGTPTAASTASNTLRVTDVDGFSADTAVTWDIAPAPAVASLSSHGTVGTAFSANVSASGGHTPYTYTWAASTPFNGLSLNAATGAITGTPTVAATYTTRLAITDALGVVSPAPATLSITVHAAVTIGGAYANNVPRTSTYSFTPSVAGGWPGYTFSISAGALPTGLSLNTSTGAITGTCSTQGVFTATLRVVDADGNAATMAFNVTVSGDLSLTGAVTNYATTGVAYNGSTLAGSGGNTPYVFSVVAGALPTGLSLNTSTGAITGTPTGSNGNGVASNFTVRVTDANASWAQAAFSITVANPPSLTGSLPDGSVGFAYSSAYAISGGFLPLTYAVASGALPAGLSLNTSTGVVSGTPTTAASYSFAIRVTDTHGNVFTHASDTVVVYAVPALSGTLTNHAEVTDPYSSGLSVTGGKAPINWSVQGTIPPGLSFSASTGLLSGTPTSTAPGTYNVTIVVTDALGHGDSSAQSVVVKAATSFTNGYEAAGTVGQPYHNFAPVVSGGWSAYSYALASGTLPAGTTLNGSTGVISGTLTTVDTFTFAIRVTDSLGVSSTLTRTVSVVPALALSGTAHAGTKGVAYSFTPTMTGGWGPFTYSVIAGSLPPGLSYASGKVSGTPTTAGTYTPTIKALDTAVYGGSSDTLALSIQIVNPPVLTLSYPRGEAGYAYSGSASVSGGDSPFSYRVISGTLPAGVSLNASTGALTGTPTTATNYNFWVRVTDAQGNIDDALASVTIAAAISTGTDLPDGRVGTAYSATATSTGGWSPYTWSISAGTLPPGLSFSSAGAMSGTPTTAGTYSFTIKVTDGDGHFSTRAQSVVIAAATVALNASATPNPTGRTTTSSGPVNVSATSNVTAAGGTSPYTYTWSFVSASGDPPAFTVSHSTPPAIGAIVTGYPPYDRSEIWRCTVRDAVGATVAVNVTIHLAVQNTA